MSKIDSFGIKRALIEAAVIYPDLFNEKELEIIGNESCHHKFTDKDKMINLLGKVIDRDIFEYISQKQQRKNKYLKKF